MTARLGAVLLVLGIALRAAGAPESVHAVTADGPLQWRAQQRFGPPPPPASAHAEPAPDEEADWTIECAVDLREPLGDAPAIALVRIGL